jgi:4-amino-4-deoxy-L-arabinose transferase-like glycosyltransferase
MDDARSAPTGHRQGPAAAIVWVLLWLLALAALSVGTGSMALNEPDEGRNAEVAREMLERGDFVVPHLNGLPYLDKPVFLFAAAAVAIAAFGPTEYAARFPSLLFTLATVLLVIALARTRFTAGDSLLAGLMLATSPLVITFSHIVIFDAVMMFWISLACTAFHMGYQREDRLWPTLGWAAAGFAVLTKGPVGLVLPLLVGIAEGLACGYRLRRMFPLPGALLFVLIVAPWFFAVTARQPEFPHYAFIRETFERVATDRMNRTAGIHYIPAFLLGGSLPWAVLLFAGWRQLARFWSERKDRARTEAFLMLWMLVPVVFFTLSQSKRPGYILVSVPAVALLCTRILHEAPQLLRYALWTAVAVAATLGVVLVSSSDYIATRVHGDQLARVVADASPIAGTALLAAAAVGLAGLRIRRLAVAGVALAPIALVLGMQPVLGATGEARSARQAAHAIRAAGMADAEVVTIGNYPPSLSYYLERPVLVTTDDGTAIRSNYIEEYVQELSGRPGSTLRPADWWQRQLADCPRPTVFVVDDRQPDASERLRASLPQIGDPGRYTAYGPCVPRGR